MTAAKLTGLLTPSAAYKPLRYPWAYEFWKRQQQVHWLPEEVPLGEDCKDWATKLSDGERNLLTQIFRFFTQSDIEVADNYMERYGRVFNPTEVKMMLSSFANMETVHIAAYALLLETIGMPESEFGAFLEYQAMRDKHDFMQKFGVDTNADIARTLAMFGGFTEGLQLFASFAMLMNFPRFNKMKGMGQIVSWSVRDESLHCEGIIKLYHAFNKETGAVTKAVADDIVDLEADTTTVRVHGFLARPQSARKTVAHQYFFVNGRYFGSGYLRKAVLKGYEGFIAADVQPSWFIWLEVDPADVDVNISPTKSEVKFADENVVFQILYACVKETLGRNAFGDGIDFDAASGVQMPVLGRNFEAIHGPVSAPAPDLDPNYDPFSLGGSEHTPGSAPGGFPAEWGVPPEGRATRGSEAPHEQSHSAQSYTPDRYDQLFDGYPSPAQAARESAATSTPASAAPGTTAGAGPNLLIVKGRYIVSPAASGLLAVHIRRARERVAYEQALAALNHSAHISQKSLFPVAVQVGPAARLLFEEQAGTLEALGFDIAPFGADTVVVNGVPEGFSCEPGKVEQMVQDLVLILSDSNPAAPSDMVWSAVAAKFATLESIGFTVANAEEANALVDSLFACENSELTPSGRRIVTLIPLEDIDKKF